MQCYMECNLCMAKADIQGQSCLDMLGVVQQKMQSSCKPEVVLRRLLVWCRPEVRVLQGQSRSRSEMVLRQDR